MKIIQVLIFISVYVNGEDGDEQGNLILKKYAFSNNFVWFFIDNTPCIDKHYDCKIWAQNGFCESHPTKMTTECKKSCKVCTSNEPEPTPPPMITPRPVTPKPGTNPSLSNGNLFIHS
jgi:hypothetical protein